MNQQLKTVLLTILTLSVFAVALVELSGVSKTAIINKYKFGTDGMPAEPEDEVLKRQKEAKAMPKTIMTFVEKQHNFGTIKEGEVVKHAYAFRNTGENPLLIYNAVASCGCTVPSYPKEPIPPGGEGQIVVEFNSHNRKGHQQKNVLVYSNAQEESISIGFEVDVTEK